MRCQLCESQTEKIYKVIRKSKIYECSLCQLAFIDQKVLTVTKLLKDDTSELYNFENYKKDEGRLRKRFKKLTVKITAHKKSGSVLDVGAGFGLFSSELNKTGDFNFDLIEPGLKLRYVGKLEKKIYPLNFEKFKAGRKYDIILMMDVLEHYINPLKNLEKAKRLLKKEGILVIQTPNYKSLMASICRDWAWWMVEDHKFFFSPKSLRLILEKAGFGSQHLMTYEDREDFKKNLDGNFVKIKNHFLRAVIKGVYFTIFFPIYFVARNMLWRLNYGGLIFVIADKVI